jgi:hypothetical protein
MTKAYYFKVFGKLWASDEDKKLLLIERSFYAPESSFNEDDYTSKTLKKLDFEVAEVRDSTNSYSGKYSFKMDSVNYYSTNVIAKYKELTKKDHAFIKITAFVFPTGEIEENPFSLVAQFEHKKRGYGHVYYGSDKMELKANRWNKINMTYLTPEVRNPKDVLKVYFETRGKAPVFIDDLQVEVFERRQ